MPLLGTRGAASARGFGSQQAQGFGPTDPYFYATSLLLNGDSINGTRTFNSDASTNNFLLKPNGLPGNSVQNPYQAGYYSNYIPSGSYFTAPDNAAFDFGAGDFTIEGWANLSSTSGTQNIVCRNYSASTGFILSNVNFLANITTDWDVNITFSSGFTANTWQHFAVVRNGNVFTCYINGASVGTQTISGTIQASSGDLQIGRRNGQSGFAGYLSNMRIVKGTAVYTTTFTPPTAPLTNISGTSILTCQANRFIDSSTNAFTITPNGTPTVAQNQPFTYTTPVTNGSGYFNGSSFLNFDDPSNLFDLGGLQASVEMWVYPLTTHQSVAGLFFRKMGEAANWNATTGIEYHVLYYQGKFVFGYNVSGNPVDLNSPITSYPAKQWYHIAVATDGANNIALFVNGTRVATASSAITKPTNRTEMKIGVDDTGNANYFNGYMTNLRFISGSEAYSPTSTTITIPSAPATAVTGTRLLTLQNNVPAQNSTFVDDSVNQFLITRNGNTTQGSFSPYGTLWSNYFGAGDTRLSIPSASNLQLGSSNFTIEGWVFNNSFGSSGSFLLGKWNYPNKSYYFGFTASNLYFGVSTDGTSDTAQLNATVSLATNTWYHIAAVRNGNTLYFYVNGTQVGTASCNYTFYSGSDPLMIGGMAGGGTSWQTFGYISNARLVIGTAVYTGNFTPSTTPLTAVTNTQYLGCQSNRFIDNSSNNATVSVNAGTPSVQRFSPFKRTRPYSTTTNGGSGYFDGTGDYLLNTTEVTNQFTPTSGFTLDFWVYQTATQAIVFQVAGSSNSWNGSTGILLSCYANYSGTFYWQFSRGSNQIYEITGTGVPINQWCHVAIGYNGTTTRVWINGSSLGTSTGAYNVPSYSKVSIGNNCIGSGDSNLSGYMSDVRFIKGVDVYGVGNSTITVPTAPLTTTPATQLFTNFTNAGIPDLAMQNNLETVGNAQVSTSVVKYGTGSLAFDGSGDSLLTPSSPLVSSWTGNFTIECWVYANTSTQYIICTNSTSHSDGLTGCYIKVDGSVGFGRFGVNEFTTSAGAVTSNTWTHLAFVGNSGTVTTYVNGVSSATGSQSTYATTTVKPLTIGRNYQNTPDYSNGYIDDFRITYGLARYTANFTPPTAALPKY